MGFLPRKGGKRTQMLERIAATEEAVVLFEAPSRVAATLRDLAAHMPERRVCIGRELTKKFEELTLTTLAEAAALEREWLGEFTLVLGPGASSRHEPDIEDLDDAIDQALAAGEPVREIAERLAAAAKLPRRDVYQHVLQRRDAASEQDDGELAGQSD